MGRVILIMTGLSLIVASLVGAIFVSAEWALLWLLSNGGLGLALFLAGHMRSQHARSRRH